MLAPIGSYMPPNFGQTFLKWWPSRLNMATTHASQSSYLVTSMPTLGMIPANKLWPSPPWHSTWEWPTSSIIFPSANNARTPPLDPHQWDTPKELLPLYPGGSNNGSPLSAWSIHHGIIWITRHSRYRSAVPVNRHTTITSTTNCNCQHPQPPWMNTNLMPSSSNYWSIMNDQWHPATCPTAWIAPITWMLSNQQMAALKYKVPQQPELCMLCKAIWKKIHHDWTIWLQVMGDEIQACLLDTNNTREAWHLVKIWYHCYAKANPPRP